MSDLVERARRAAGTYWDKPLCLSVKEALLHDLAEEVVCLRKALSTAREDALRGGSEMWALIHEQHGIVPGHIQTSELAIRSMVVGTCGPPSETWSFWEKLGYRCVPVTVIMKEKTALIPQITKEEQGNG